MKHMKIKMTKVICTIGPKSESSEMLQQLVQNGMNIMRLNFSHGDYEEHGGRIDRLREITDNTGRYIGILLDTKGPEIRTGKLEGGNDVLLEAGNKITITTDYSHVGNKDKISVSYPGIVNDLKPGNTILLDDGLIGLEVLEIKDNEIFCEIKNTGELGEIKGVNLPGVSVGLPALAEKDIADLKFGCEKGVDFVAASFIRKASDVAEVRRVLDENGGARIQIISKIENPSPSLEAESDSVLLYIIQKENTLYQVMIAVKEKTLSKEFIKKWSKVFRSGEFFYEYSDKTQ